MTYTSNLKEHMKTHFKKIINFERDLFKTNIRKEMSMNEKRKDAKSE